MQTGPFSKPFDLVSRTDIMDSLYYTVAGIRWQDIIDILINSYILFRLYMLFRGTNVIRMLMVIVLLWFFKHLAAAMGMIVTSWIIQGFIAVAALLVIIVFRNEIAGIFQPGNLRTILWGIPKHQSRTSVEIITDSLTELARRRLGALIVLPFKKDISDIVHGGISWKGNLSKEMLLSIFWNGAPVHDGAAVIQGNQIVRAAAILPLSKKKGLPDHFGTRHRAAVGLAELSDALIMVVSEERGDITLFKDQNILPVRSSNELQKTLEHIIGIAPDKKNGIASQKVHVCLAALFCVIFVSTIWMSFAKGVETFASFEVPVEFKDKSPDMEIFSVSSSNLKVQVSGSGSLVKAIRPDQLKVKISLANAVPGDNELTINRDGVELPPGVTLKQVEPHFIEVNIDSTVTKNLPIQPVWKGTLPPGLLMTGVEITPAAINVRGAKLALENIQTVYTEAIALDAISADGETQTGLMLLPENLTLEDPSLTKVAARYTIVKRNEMAYTPDKVGAVNR